jgi:hypothetical protein
VAVQGKCLRKISAWKIVSGTQPYVGETTMAINVFGVLIWCTWSGWSPIRRSREIACSPPRLSGTLERGMCVLEAPIGSTDVATGYGEVDDMAPITDTYFLFYMYRKYMYSILQSRTWPQYTPVIAPSELAESHWWLPKCVDVTATPGY